MSSNPLSDCFAFLTVRYHEAIGYFGGLLSINTLGRPAEFHCSLPIKPSRAQIILYGDSLEDFLVGEQISHALYAKMRSTPLAIFADSEPILALRRLCSIPVACIEGIVDSDKVDTNQDHSKICLFRPTGSQHLKTIRFRLKDTPLLVNAEHENDIAAIEKIWQASSPQFNMLEPFGRIVEALREANPTSKAA